MQLNREKPTLKLDSKTSKSLVMNKIFHENNKKKTNLINQLEVLVINKKKTNGKRKLIVMQI